MKKIVLSLVVIVSFGISASAQLYDQTAGVTINGVISAYMTNNDTIVQCADDFEVPSGSSWSVTSVTVHGFRNFQGPNMTELTVELWSDLVGPDAIIYSENVTLSGLGVPTPSNDTALVLNLSVPQTLTPGVYWLSVYGYSEANSRWNWTSHGPSVIGSEAMLLDADDYFGTGSIDWTNVTDLGLIDSDFAFAINGTDANAAIREISNELSIYPNPAIYVLNIESETNDVIEEVVLMNVDGKVVHRELNPKTEIDISELPAGAYLVEVSTAYGISRTEFVKR